MQSTRLSLVRDPAYFGCNSTQDQKRLISEAVDSTAIWSFFAFAGGLPLNEGRAHRARLQLASMYSLFFWANRVDGAQSAGRRRKRGRLNVLCIPQKTTQLDFLSSRFTAVTLRWQHALRCRASRRSQDVRHQIRHGIQWIARLGSRLRHRHRHRLLRQHWLRDGRWLIRKTWEWGGLTVFDWG